MTAPESTPGDPPKSLELNYLAELEAVRTAAVEVRIALDDLDPVLEAIGQQLTEGRDAAQAIIKLKGEDADQRRRTLHNASRRLESKLQHLRGLSMRILVDQGGLTITQAGRLSGISTQMARRLYQRASRCGPRTT